eukprot:6227428-Ditylum_brightwellii.AAC.1
MKTDLETRLSTTMTTNMETNMSQLTQMMEANGQRMRETISSILNTQGASSPSQTALALGCVEQSSASDAMEG